MPINNRVLENGIRLITEPIATTEAVAIGFWFPSGSRDEGLNERGVTHFTEHMLFKGTRSLSSYDIARFFDRAGGYVNAFTEREMLCVHCVVPSMFTLDAVRMLVSMIYDSLFTDDAIEKERSVIISEVLSALDDPEETGMDKALESMYPAHSFSYPIAGTVADVKSLANEDIRQFYHTYFESVGPVVTIAGRFNVDEVELFLASVLFSGKNHSWRTDAERANDTKPVWSSGSIFPRSSFEQSQLFISFPLPLIHSAREWYALSMLNAMLGDTVSSRLYQRTREEMGLCYSIGSFFAVNRDSAFLTAFAAVPSEKTLKALDTMIAEIERAVTGGFTDVEIDDSRKHLAGELFLAAEDTENRMKRLARQWFHNSEILDITELANVINSVSVDELTRFLSCIGNSLDRSLVVYANRKGLREAKKRWK